MTAPAQSTSFPLHDLCTRALSDPTSITPSERNLIRGRPDPDTEHSLYIAKTSLPLSALVAKALTDPPTLSPDEAQVLVHGPVDRTHAEKAARFQAYDALTKEQRDLLDRASSAVADKDEQKAGNIAYLLLRDAKAKELGRPKETTTIYHTAASTAPRVREKNYTSWGLPVLRTAYADPAAWLAFKTRLSALAARALATVAPPDIVSNFSIQYIDDEDALAGAEQAGMLAYYARVVREGKVGEGHQWGVFISADENVLEIFSEERREWIIPVWEAAWRAGEVGKAGWNGSLAMKADLVFAILMPDLVRGTKTPLENLNMMALNRKRGDGRGEEYGSFR